MSNSATMAGLCSVTSERHMVLAVFLNACCPRQASDDNLATSNMIQRAWLHAYLCIYIMCLYNINAYSIL